MPSTRTNDDANIDNGSFYVEPWTVRQSDAALTVADETPAGAHLVATITGIAAAAATGLLIGWLFSAPFRWLGIGLGILAITRTFQLIINGRRQSQRWEFLRTCDEIRLNGEKVSRFDDVSEIVIIQTDVTHFNPDSSRDFKHESHFSVQLRIDDREFGFGAYRAENSANRLARAIASFVNKPLLLRSAPPIVNA